MTESERIDLLIRSLENGSNARFAEKIGLSTPQVFKMRKGQVGIRLQIGNIIQAYPQVRREWLETGEGYPGDLTVDLVRRYYEDKIHKADKIIDHLMRRIDDLENVLQNGTNDQMSY